MKHTAKCCIAAATSRTILRPKEAPFVLVGVQTENLVNENLGIAQLRRAATEIPLFAGLQGRWPWEWGVWRVKEHPRANYLL